MRTTLILDEGLIERARELTGIKEKTALVHRSLELLIARESARQLANLAGAAPRINPVRRRRSNSAR
jgi:putative antitoxin of VapBC-like toxin-antitoxin system